MKLSMSISSEKGFKIITISGTKLNYNNLSDMEKEVFDEVEGGGQGFILDLSEITQIDSFALGFIMNLYRRIMEEGGGLSLISAHPRVRAVLGVARVDEVIPVYKTKEEAVTGLANEKD